jgi:hypothetical protein
MFEENDDFNEDYESRQNNVRKMPIFLKGEEIIDVVCKIIELIPEENEMLGSVKESIIENAFMLTSKIVNAEAGELYDLKMENAAIIRKAACDLNVQNHALKNFGFEHPEYFQIVRNLIEEYRLLFIDWVASFDINNYIVDRWGLFNPPGVSPFDEK